MGDDRIVEIGSDTGSAIQILGHLAIDRCNVSRSNGVLEADEVRPRELNLVIALLPLSTTLNAQRRDVDHGNLVVCRSEAQVSLRSIDLPHQTQAAGEAAAKLK